MQPLSESEYVLWLIELLKQGKTILAPVRGMSMFPFLLKGDIIKVSPANFHSLNPGDVVVYCIDGKLVAHRLIKRDLAKGVCITRGDGNSRADSPIQESSIIGTVTAVVSSRFSWAKVAIGKAGKYLAFTAPVTGPLFYISGVVAYKVKTWISPSETDN
ncbi:signal peptidase I [Alkaliflexus imshenetskii]|uniref:signal peptidase I n=1 Tax=Alkaliflexus imshenetskii TaxID=286730 RepID=UPI0004B0F398|nr:signal peptidase I [Alkaliflexus imshenetskii]